MTIGEAIKIARKERKLTQKQLAELSGVAEITIRKYEANTIQPKIDNLTKIATALNLGIEVFMRSVGNTALSPRLSLITYLESLGYKITFYEDISDTDGAPICALFLQDLNQGKQYQIKDADITELEKAITSFSRFQVMELINRLGTKH